MSRRVYGEIGVDIGALASKLAQDMVKAGRESVIQQREEAAKARFESRDADVFFIGRRAMNGDYIVESVEGYDKLGQVTGRGPTMQCALANARMAVARHLVASKAVRNMNQAQEKIAKIDFRVADMIENRGGMGSATGRISVGAGS
jgi:hypothetical protein